MESIKEVVDSLCISQQSRDGAEERVVLFLKMAPEVSFSPELVKQVRRGRAETFWGKCVCVCVCVCVCEGGK